MFIKLFSLPVGGAEDSTPHCPSRYILFFSLCMPLRHLFGISCSRMPLRAEFSQYAAGSMPIFAGINMRLCFADLNVWPEWFTKSHWWLLNQSGGSASQQEAWLTEQLSTISAWADMLYAAADRYTTEKLIRQNSHTQRFHSQSVGRGGGGVSFNEWFPMNKTNSHTHAQMLLIIAGIFLEVYLILSHWSSNV